MKNQSKQNYKTNTLNPKLKNQPLLGGGGFV